MFIQTQVENMKDKSFIKIRGILVDILCEIDLHYKIYLNRYKRGGETVAHTILECALWYNGCRNTIILQFHQEPEGNRVQAEYVRHLRLQHDHYGIPM